MSPPDFTLTPRGPFSLASAARFIAGWPPSGQTRAPDAAVRLGFLTDDFAGAAGVVLRQDGDGLVHGRVVDGDPPDVDAVARQAARIVSLDHDGSGYAALGERDPVIGGLQRRKDWLRPVLFHSPYEAACWAVLSARIRQPQAVAIRERLSREHGRVLAVDGEELVAFPAPEALLALEAIAGLNGEKVARLHGVARAALEGRLDREALLALPPDEAVARVRELRGIGPFWGEAIVLRAVGTTDALTLVERRGRERAAAAYGRPDVVDDDDAFVALAEGWRPFRTWVSVLLRAGEG